MSGKRFFGLHMVEGVARYRPKEGDPFNVFVGEDTIKMMDPSFEGKPVYAYNHVKNADKHDDIREEGDLGQPAADGVVVKSFFNKADGKHWVEFMIFSDEGLNCIRDGYRLSNAYRVLSQRPGGQWHGVDYAKEVASGEYDHLALVQKPRYEESVILTPEEFKAYNEQKEADLLRLQNSKEETKKEKPKMKLKFNWFKREKIENSADASNVEQMVVQLPKSGKEMTVEQLVERCDYIENLAGYADESHVVKVGNEEMSVKDLVKKHMNMCSESEKMKNEMDEMKKKENSDDKKEVENTDKQDEMKEEDGKMKVKAENSEEKKEEKKENADDKKEEVKNSHFETLSNAKDRALDMSTKVDFSMDKAARGKSRYGSTK